MQLDENKIHVVKDNSGTVIGVYYRNKPLKFITSICNDMVAYSIRDQYNHGEIKAIKEIVFDKNLDLRIVFDGDLNLCQEK